MNGIQIKPLLVPDADCIPALTESGVRGAVFPLTIYSSPKYNQFVKNAMTNSSQAKFFGAYYHDDFLGFAEWRTTEEELFLNNIAISKESRGLGVGSFLYHNGISTLQTPSMKFLALDVFEENIEAKLWYERLGYELHDFTYWQVGQQQSDERFKKIDFHIANLQEAQEHHGKYGFSMLIIVTNQDQYRIGRINDNYFRISHEGLTDCDLLGALYQIDRDRRLLLLSKQPAVDGFEKVCTSNRMRMSLSHQMGGIYGYQNSGSK